MSFTFTEQPIKLVIKNVTRVLSINLNSYENIKFKLVHQVDGV